MRLTDLLASTPPSSSSSSSSASFLAAARRLAALAAVVTLGACAQDGAQELRVPEAPVAAANPPAPNDGVHAPQRFSSADVRAELEAAQRKDGSNAVAHADGHTEASADGGASATSTTDATGGADGGAAGTPEGDPERVAFENKAKERLARLDAHAKELKDKSAKLTATKKTTVESGLRRFSADRTDTETRLGALARSGAAWRSAKTNVERSLEDLESALAKLDDQL